MNVWVVAGFGSFRQAATDFDQSSFCNWVLRSSAAVRAAVSVNFA